MEESSPSGRKMKFCGPKSGDMGRPDERETLSQCAPIVEHDMAKVEWADAIKTVSGALVKINKKSPHAADQKMVLGTHRVAPTTSTSCSRIYLRGLSAVTRSTPVSSDETLARNRFAAIGRAAAARKKNLSTIAADTAAFNAQKESGYKTFRQYIWHVCADEYDQSQG